VFILAAAIRACHEHNVVRIDDGSFSLRMMFSLIHSLGASRFEATEYSSITSGQE
jgi:hypothetical protein